MTDTDDDFSLLANRITRKQRGITLVQVGASGVLTEKLKQLQKHFAERVFYHAGYDPAQHADAIRNPKQLVDRCLQDVTAADTIVLLYPHPTLSAATDAQRIAFWKQLNFQRERLGELPAQVILWIDNYNQDFAWDNAKDLLSWCMPKLRLEAAANPELPNFSAIQQGIMLSGLPEQTPRRAQLTWDSLMPLFEAAPRPLSANDIQQLLLPLSQAAITLYKLEDQRRFLAIGERQLPENSAELGTLLNNLGLNLIEVGNYTEAEPLFWRSLAIVEAFFSEKPIDVVAGLNNLGSLYRKMERYDEAKQFYERALAITDQILGIEDPKTAKIVSNLAIIHYISGNLARVEPLMLRVLHIYRKAYGNSHPDVALALYNLGALYQNLLRYEEAKPLLERSLAIRESFLGVNHPDVAFTLNNLSLLHLDLHRYEEAEPLLRRAVDILKRFQQATGHEHPHFLSMLQSYQQLLQKLGTPQADIDAAVASIGQA